MSGNKYLLPIMSRIDLKTGKTVTEFIEVTEDMYLEFFKPIAEILADGFVNELLNKKAG